MTLQEILTHEHRPNLEKIHVKAQHKQEKFYGKKTKHAFNLTLLQRNSIQ